jgi:hypothetical protein
VLIPLSTHRFLKVSAAPARCLVQAGPVPLNVVCLDAAGRSWNQ